MSMDMLCLIMMDSLHTSQSRTPNNSPRRRRTFVEASKKRSSHLHPTQSHWQVQ
jgi:hypothetical protein